MFIPVVFAISYYFIIFFLSMIDIRRRIPYTPLFILFIYFYFFKFFVVSITNIAARNSHTSIHIKTKHRLRNDVKKWKLKLKMKKKKKKNVIYMYIVYTCTYYKCDVLCVGCSYVYYYFYYCVCSVFCVEVNWSPIECI